MGGLIKYVKMIYELLAAGGRSAEQRGVPVRLSDKPENVPKKDNIENKTPKTENAEAAPSVKIENAEAVPPVKTEDGATPPVEAVGDGGSGPSAVPTSGSNTSPVPQDNTSPVPQDNTSPVPKPPENPMKDTAQTILDNSQGQSASADRSIGQSSRPAAGSNSGSASAGGEIKVTVSFNPATISMDKQGNFKDAVMNACIERIDTIMAAYRK